MARATQLIKATFKDWADDEAPRLGAALAYYTVFSLAPLLLIAIGIAGIVFGEQAVQGQLVGQLGGLLGQQGAQLLQTMIANSAKGGGGWISTIAGLVLLVVGASGVFGQLQAAMNKIWEVGPDPDAGLRGFVKKRIVAMSMVFSVGLLLIVSLVVSAALSAFSDLLQSRLVGGVFLWQAVNAGVSLGVLMLFFASVFKVMPDADVRWRDVWFGAFVTAVLFSIGKELLMYYLGRSAVAANFGPAAALVALLIWVYYSAQILFLGAEFTQVWARSRGREIGPQRGAVRVVEETRIERRGQPR